MGGLKVHSFFRRRRVEGKQGHQFTIFSNGLGTSLSKFSFGNKVINEWIHLPAHVVHTDNLNTFTRGLDCYLGIRGIEISIYFFPDTAVGAGRKRILIDGSGIQ